MRSVMFLSRPVLMGAAVLTGATAAAAAKAKKPDFLFFVQKVMPIVRQHCTRAPCHGAGVVGDQRPAFQALDPKAGKKLLEADYETALKRVTPGKPKDSPFLLKPLAQRDGGVKHGGDDLFRRASAEYRTVVAWITGQRVGNVAPVANAGPGRKVDVGEKVQLDGTASADMNDDKLRFLWRIWERPPESQAKLSDARVAKPEFTPDVEGQYTVELVASDGDLRSKPDRVTIVATSRDPSMIALEPERHLVRPPLARFADVEARAGAYVAADESVRNSGQVVIPVQAPKPGRYVLWARVRADRDANAFSVAMDDAPAVPWRVKAAEEWTLQKATYGSVQAATNESSAPDRWRVLAGRWACVDGHLEGASDPEADTTSAAAVIDTELAEGLVHVDVTPQPGAGSSAMIVFDYRGKGKSRYAGLDVDRGRLLIGPDEPVAVRKEALEPNRTYRVALRLRRIGQRWRLVQLLVDRQLKLERLYAEPLAGRVGLSIEGGRTYFDDFVVSKGARLVLHDEFSSGPKDRAPLSAGQTGQTISWLLKEGEHRLTISVLTGGTKLDQLQLRVQGEEG